MNRSALSGRRILLTRAAEQLESVATAVEARGAIPIRFPCLAVRCLPDSIREAIVQLNEFDDVLFTSVNGVQCVARTAGNLEELLAGKRVAAVGKSTASCLEEHGIEVEIVPAIASQAGLVEAYEEYGLPEQLLFFRAEEGRELLAEALSSSGTEVKTVPAYHTVCPEDDASKVLALLKDDAIDAVLLGSPKVARHYLKRIGDIELANRPLIVAISEQVAKEARQEGLGVQIVSKKASFDAMLDALANFLATASRP